MQGFAAIVLVGPSDVESKRLSKLLESLYYYEPDVRDVVLIDDAPEARALEGLVRAPATCRVTRLLAPRGKRAAGALGLTAPLLTGLEWLERNSAAQFVVKLDTDALVIDAFADEVAAFLTQQPLTGVAGAYRLTPNGEPRCFAHWGKTMRRLAKLVQIPHKRTKRLEPQLSLAWRGVKARARQHIREALARGYEPGEHCLGGSYVITMRLLRAMRARGYLHELGTWVEPPAAEEVVLAMYARACGLELADLAYQRPLFGIRYIGLADSPQRLLSRGFSIIHSVKNDQHVSEDEIYAFFDQQRAGYLLPLAANQASPASSVDGGAF